jgi:hypothetical protein
MGENTQMTYYADTCWLIVKLLLSIQHEGSHRQLARLVERAQAAMGIPFEEWFCLGRIGFKSPASDKEIHHSNPCRPDLTQPIGPHLLLSLGTLKGLIV